MAAVLLARHHAEKLSHPLATEISEVEWRMRGLNILWSVLRELLRSFISGTVL